MDSTAAPSKANNSLTAGNINQRTAATHHSSNDHDESVLEFPRGDTVPFPYETPYPQQTALMDTLLQCLEQKEQAKDQAETKRQQRAAVMMLESPTGTGKSLSLACSAMAWLKYCEQRDFQQKQDTTKLKEETTTKNDNDDDWWNAWVPPEQSQKEQELQTSRRTAQQTRDELGQELDMWRSKLYGDQPDAERAQQRRDNFVRSAVTTAKMAERVDHNGRNKNKRTKKANNGQQPIKEKQEDFCVPDYTSDPEKTIMDSDSEDEGERNEHNKKHTLGKATQLLDGHRLDGSYRDNNNKGSMMSSQQQQQQYTIGNVPPGTGVRKIVYAARTHSQLSQFVGELKRTVWGSDTRVVALGSRQLLCGNAALKKAHPTEASLTEACLDLKQGKKTTGATTGSKKRNSQDKNNKTSSSSWSSCGCTLLESKEAVSTLGLHLLTTPSDIEDAARLGSASHTCAYYASRKALAAAEVVVLPYSMLLSRPTRQAIGLSLKECLVLVDEAHNLPEALRSIHSSQLSLPVIQAAMQQLTRYTQTYAQRLAGRNLIYLGNLRKLLQAFVKYLKSDPTTNSEKVHVKEKENQSGRNNAASATTNKKRILQSTASFIMELKVDNINLFKLLRYMENSRLSQKLLGFTRSKDEEEQQIQEKAGLSKHVSAMSIVQAFLEKLNLGSQEGKVVTDWPSDANNNNNNNRIQHPTLRYVLLNPATCFDNILEEAHALALVGGTLAPFGHVAAELLAGELQKKEQSSSDKSLLQLASEADASFQKRDNDAEKSSGSSMSFVSHQFAAFTCDHVVSPSNVFLQCLSMGPTTINSTMPVQKFDFRHQTRMAPALCRQLGQALLQLSKVIPNGLVVFLPSYSYEAYLVRQWQESGLWEQLDKSKKIFREPKSAQHLESTLRVYSKQAATNNNNNNNQNGSIGGAILLAVIGGKMSEGINLANEMARGVVVVGLPYPDITDPELREKMDMMTKHGVGGLSGQAYYQSLCMRAVNQSVGRAIRHANDYAAILLCDYRYTSQRNIWASLPKWLRSAGGRNKHQGCNQPEQTSFQSISDELEHFFRGKAVEK